MALRGLRRLSAILSGLLVLRAGAQDTWCGKVYNGTAQIIPGGFLTEPETSQTPLLDVQVIPRHSIYVSSEASAEIIVDAALSSYHGSPYLGAASVASNASDTFTFTVSVAGVDLFSATVGVNTTDNLFRFSVSQLAPSTTAYPVALTGSTKSGNYSASSELFYLPDKANGSVVKIDRLYRSILYRSNNTDGVFKPYLPYGYYGSYSGYFDEVGNPTVFRDRGFNALNPVTDFSDGDMTYTIDEMDGIDLLWQYDMRNSFQNLTSVAAQIPLVKDHPSLLSYYTADEPDGWGYTFNSTTNVYDLVAALDRYHPTALVLNCQNYYFHEYSAGADILMQDAYPVGINATFSTKWDTPVNLTYGDSGCDNCVGSYNLLNVPQRIDDFQQYARWIGGAETVRKPIWAVPQAFSGEDYWSRDPTAAEAWAMDLLAFNHGAKGRLAWIYPPSAVLANATAALARVVTASPVVDYLTGAHPVLVSRGRVAGKGGDSSDALDVAYWAKESEDGGGAAGVLVGVVNPANATVSQAVVLPSGLGVSAVSSQPWGNVSWSFDAATGVLTPLGGGGVPAKGTSYVILE
ncbi:hypothetical protein BD289DRAFT_487184 [Coniella lustricola]|uniref:Glycoside hydrolase superfamily n=1 Tax=Coniella lustricola TaxID=2025994 RepID=A0A2T2ZSL2_9PEZI|nr:hypothetical protein BD289DRAFT_487184 [Coniella lustricola]